MSLLGVLKTAMICALLMAGIVFFMASSMATLQYLLRSLPE